MRDVVLGALFGLALALFLLITMLALRSLSLPVCSAEDEVIVMTDYPHPDSGYRCIHIDDI